jgi:ubiquinone/menaquinone biosynthesis C-methylase UbiE
MAKDETHEGLVERQFGARASSYLGSAVHARGPDLDALGALLDGKKDASVLDLGCGAGHVSFAVAPRVRAVIAYDLSAEMLALVAREAEKRGLANLSTRQGVVERLPFADAEFDAVLSRYSAHHWRDVEAGLREAARVLKPGGVLGFVDALAPGNALFDTYLQAIELLRDPSHVRDYSLAQWQAALARAGLMPSAARCYRIRLDFASWVARMRTPQLQVDAIRALQQAMSESVTRYFAIGADGSFDLDIALIVATKPG